MIYDHLLERGRNKHLRILVKDIKREYLNIIYNKHEGNPLIHIIIISRLLNLKS